MDKSNSAEIKLTTVDILKILPIDDEVRKKILDVYPEKVSYEKGVIIEELAWDTYYKIFDAKYASQLYQKISSEKRAFGVDMHTEFITTLTEEARIRAEEVQTAAQIQDTRSELKSLVN